MGAQPAKSVCIFLLFFLVASFSYAAAGAPDNSDAVTCFDLSRATTVGALFQLIPTLNTDLATCPPSMPGALNYLIKTGNLQGQITMNDGSTRSFVMELRDGQLIGIREGTASSKYIAKTDETSADQLLQSSNKFPTFAHLYSTKKITLVPNTFWGKLVYRVSAPFIRMGIKGKAIAPVAVNLNYAGKWTCDFYQAPWPNVNKVHVTCGAVKNADTWCVTVLGSPYAKAEACDANGLVICSNPCTAPVKQIIPRSCPFDNDRARGSQAAPVQNCPIVTAPAAKPKSPTNCMDTYLAGHDAYQSSPQAKALWESYSAQTSGVCQVLQGMPAKECVYSVQTAKTGVSQPYYLCWYN